MSAIIPAERHQTHTHIAKRGYELFRTRDTYPDERKPHHHEFYEIVLIWAGSVHYLVANHPYHLTNGDILLISPGEVHNPAPEQDWVPCERMILRFDSTFVQLLHARAFDPAACFHAGPAKTVRLHFDDDATPQIFELLERCLREKGGEAFGASMMADTILIQALIHINRLCRKVDQRENRSRSGTLVGNVLDYINSHYDEELTLDSLANRFFISKYHLSREFGRIVGASVHRYIVQKRLVVAKQLLREGRPSSTVYQQCGFGDYSNFYRAFKSEYGISPKEFVENLRDDRHPGRN